MGAEDGVFDAFQRLLEELERYLPLPPGLGGTGSPTLHSASIHAPPPEADRSPAVEVIETATHVYVTADLSGLRRESVSVRVGPDDVAILAVADGQGVEVRAPLPARVRAESAMVTDRNGVLDVSLEKEDRDTDAR